jgi:hypothetical protein
MQHHRLRLVGRPGAGLTSPADGADYGHRESQATAKNDYRKLLPHIQPPHLAVLKSLPRDISRILG